MWRRPGAIGSPDDEYANPVSDLKLSAYYTRTSGDGPFRLVLSRSVDVDHTFTAELTRDGVHLIHRTSSGEVNTWDKTYPEAGLNPDKPMFVELVNVDYRATLRINGNEVFHVDYAPNVDWLLDQYRNHPRMHDKFPEARIEAENQTCTLDHISLYRDVYYTNRGFGGLHTGTPDNPVTLAKGEYFVLGDNSAISKDARFWDSPIDLPHEGLYDMPEGRVPEQFMLGKAVFVYWPAGYRISNAFPYSIIPNFGDMRLDPLADNTGMKLPIADFQLPIEAAPQKSPLGLLSYPLPLYSGGGLGWGLEHQLLTISSKRHGTQHAPPPIGIWQSAIGNLFPKAVTHQNRG